MQGLMRQMAVPVLGAVVLVHGGAGTSTQSLMAQGAEHAHHETGDPRGKAGALVKAVREATERFKDVAVAEADKLRAHVRLRQRPGLRGDGPPLRELPAGRWTARSTWRSRRSSSTSRCRTARRS